MVKNRMFVKMVFPNVGREIVAPSRRRTRWGRLRTKREAD